MIKVALVRGKYLNNFEGQNYLFDQKKIKLTAISSYWPINKNFPFPVIRLFSPADLQNIFFLEKPVKFLLNRILGDSQLLLGLENLYRDFDIFHTADPHYFYSYQLAKLRAQNKISKLIATSWETIPFNNESVPQKKFIKKFTQRNIDFFICYTQKAKECLIKEGVPEEKIAVVKLGVDLKKFRPPDQKPKSATAQILFVGRAVDEKGINDLKKAIKGLKANLKIVKFGTLDYSAMPKIYQKADLLIFPSKKTKTWEEQYGMVLVEAMASALPIVAYDSGAIKEVVGEAGILVPENNLQQLALKVKYLTDNKKQRLKIGKMGRRRAEKYYDARKTSQALKKIYETIYHYHH